MTILKLAIFNSYIKVEATPKDSVLTGASDYGPISGDHDSYIAK